MGIIIPRIIKETSKGIQNYEIVDEMLQYREIECVGEINMETVYSLIQQLRYLQRVSPDKEITLFINSPGGEVSSGLALYDVMQAVKCPIRTVCVGMAASMGAVLFAAGDKREMLPHARIMIHDPLISGGLSGSALSIQSRSLDLMKTRETTATILAKHTGKTIEEIYEKTATDTYFGAEEAIAFGLADRIITEI
ncbi:MAG: ATP-dependent Clp protease proteolytic subunit [Clostridiales bacterium]|nr:ATP-dependent Clp protease proteolytic subunit [Clostridiales bacterium]